MIDENYITALTDEVISKIGKVKGIYRLDQDLSPSTAAAIRARLGNDSRFIIEVRMCKVCRNRYDIEVWYKNA